MRAITSLGCIRRGNPPERMKLWDNQPRFEDAKRIVPWPLPTGHHEGSRASLEFIINRHSPSPKKEWRAARTRNDRHVSVRRLYLPVSRWSASLRGHLSFLLQYVVQCNYVWAVTCGLRGIGPFDDPSPCSTHHDE